MRRTKIKKTPLVQAIERSFACPKCHQDSVVQCRIMKTQKIGYAYCSVCEAKFMCKANNLTSPIDVYSEWVDECNARA